MHEETILLDLVVRNGLVCDGTGQPARIGSVAVSGSRIAAVGPEVGADVADYWGIPDRGRLAKGQVADVVVFDAATIDRGPEELAYDLPDGGKSFRFVRRSVGVREVVVGGARRERAALRSPVAPRSRPPPCPAPPGRGLTGPARAPRGGR